MWLHPVEELLPRVSYRPGWQFTVADNRLRIRAAVIDAYDHSRETTLGRDIALPPACANLDWQRWLFDMLLQIERHEAAEFFTVEGVKVFDPHKGGTR